MISRLAAVANDRLTVVNVGGGGEVEKKIGAQKEEF